ncbi:MAG: class I mannose-6-phosphate isomerase [Bacteroidia bacterium]|nr:class I mannose-6-phosphate isomerase [Bacteroidia bacterium]
MGNQSNFNKFPAVKVQGAEHQLFAGWDVIGAELNRAIDQLDSEKVVLAVECYPGVDQEELKTALVRILNPEHLISSEEVFSPDDKILDLTWPDATDDRIFGFMTRLNMEDFLDPENIEQVNVKISSISTGIILIIGPGASLLAPSFDLLVYADMPRWEIQQRMRRNEVGNLGLSNPDADFEEKYKLGYFIDWRVADRLKKRLFSSWDFVLDTTRLLNPKMISGSSFREMLRQTVQQPFSVVPFFDPGPWGGQWMKEVCDLDPEVSNYAWCFNCIPEENSLLLDFGGITFETPAINLVFYQPVQLLGNPVHARFGDEFPIRFDYLDTMDGGNLSLQVHPLTEYIQEHFGIHYTQDESYYLLDAGPDAVVYLGLKEGVDGEEMIRDLEKAQDEGISFDDEKYIQQWPVRKHDHLLIPGGTIHCSGKNSMVLEISATPYIFTFKLWDWGRVGLDGRSRPINIEHGKNVIQWDRTTPWTRKNLVNRIIKVAEGPGWREEKTGLHKREFIETRRHWFTGKVYHETHDGVLVMNLVEGREAIVESPSGAFTPFVVHYAETFIIPASVGEFSIRPYGESEGRECATIKAFVRTNP